jgi:hypothetical protein
MECWASILAFTLGTATTAEQSSTLRPHFTPQAQYYCCVIVEENCLFWFLQFATADIVTSGLMGFFNIKAPFLLFFNPFVCFFRA